MYSLYNYVQMDKLMHAYRYNLVFSSAKKSCGSVHFSAIQMALISKQYVLWEIACRVQKSNYILASVFGFGRNDTEILKYSW